MTDTPNEGAPLPAVLPAGYRIGEWELDEPIGYGSWGCVYAAEHITERTRAAVKVLRTDLMSPGQREAMAGLLDREVRFSLQADHPHLVRTREVLSIRDTAHPSLEGTTALVMDRADRSLRDLLDATEGGPVADARAILLGISEGLADIHARRWVHGDLKPSNVLLTDTGGVWLADFGLTAELDGTHAYGPPIGTFDYVPPEWWTDQAGVRSVLRPTADIWAFGILAHQVLTGGVHPFPGADERARSLNVRSYASGSTALRLDPAIHEEWARLVAECLRPDHASRRRLTAPDLARRVRRLSGVGRGRRGRALAGSATLVLATMLIALPSGDAPSNEADSSPAPAPGSPADAFPAGSDVPRKLRPVIVRAAAGCTEKEVTPALLAAMLKEESGFDANASRPKDDEYGIAMWTPWVFNSWAADGNRDGVKDYMSPPDAIVAMASYLCWLDQRFKQSGLHKDLTGMLAAGYRSSDKTIINERGVPERLRPYVTAVQRHLAQYTK
ncbi:serine/threonine protein kinase [Streptomyces triticagri]|uniref:non-specific serine/threonine protein kinase n=1 Tax=Streptomyces triticagri TaxID=2293568 RepID=A0A372LZP1_9ACTN|nr:serine/threonine-protein kinase [Streptomyces triticagri]RFU84146.1 serine/threonine protein kinase [Streptomyces triticagri]